MKSNIRSIEFAPGKELSVDIGRLAKQAHGAVMVRLGDTMVLGTAVSNYSTSADAPFFPLTVDYRENFSAGGRFPGGFIKREGRPNEKEILSSRLIDRTIRPMFGEGYMAETQVLLSVLSFDDVNDADVLSGVAASIALTISDIPFIGPLAMVRVGRINGEFIINPTIDQYKESDMDIVLSGSKESVVMVEGEMREITEQEMLSAIKIGHDAIVKLCDFQNELREEFGVEKREFTPFEIDGDIFEKVSNFVGDKIKVVTSSNLEKKEYSSSINDINVSVKESLLAELGEDIYKEKAKHIGESLYKLQKKALRDQIIKDGKRLDGRTTTQIRSIWTEAGYLPRTHGSSIFTRGETQALVYVTLGTSRDAQSVDTLSDSESRMFILHYNFPPFCTGEAKMLRGTGRREVGHGKLAERALKMMMPDESEFNYAVRVVSDILESNGSSSMASVCGGSMALMDAGVPLKKPVSGIAMGLIVDEDGYAILSDIQGEEDFMGDMDFKLAGTADGITACQMDIKVQGISQDIMQEAMMQAREGRLHILTKMAETISVPRSEMSKYAPQLTRIEINGDEIGAIIGPGGKVIQGIQKETGTEIVIEEKNNKGIVTIAATNAEGAEKAKTIIKQILGQFDEGEIFEGTVRAVKEYGAFVEIVPGKDGLLHVSEIAHERVNNVSDYLREGDKIQVQLLKVEAGGKLKLSMKSLLPRENSYSR